jgi:hypothetical protein
VADPAARPPRTGRSESRDLVELRALRTRQPDLAEAADMHLELLELQRRVQARVSLPWLDVNAEVVARHQANGQPLLRFDQIPLDPTDVRLSVRHTAEVLRRFGTIDEPDSRRAEALGRDAGILAVVERWYRKPNQQRAAAVAPGARGGEETESPDDGLIGQVLTLAMRPFLSRCAEVLQQRPELSIWERPYCPLCGSEPEMAVITPAAERHLICGRCTLQWKFATLTCPYCGNDERSRITSFATPDGQYRVYGCDVCRRYLKAFDARRASRPVMPVVDAVATLPLDAAAMQRGYS